MGARRLVRLARELVLFERRRMPPRARAEAVPVGGTRSTALPRAALASFLLAGPLPLAETAARAAAMPLRDAGGLAVSCQIEGLPQREVAAAESALCARAAEAARRGAPYPVGLAQPGVAAALRLAVTGRVTATRANQRSLAITATLIRPGQTESAARLTAARPPVAYGDPAAVGTAIDMALAAILPWRNVRRAPVPTPPRAH